MYVFMYLIMYMYIFINRYIYFDSPSPVSPYLVYEPFVSCCPSFLFFRTNYTDTEALAQRTRRGRLQLGSG